MRFRFKITNGSEVSYSEWQEESVPPTPARVAEALRVLNPTAELQIERGPSDPLIPPVPGPPVGLLINDPNPTLGNDLQLNNHHVIGRLDKDSLVIDGGLLG